MSGLASPIFASNGVAITVARSPSDLVAVQALRAIVYMGEQDCPYEEEFDGNDFAGATHLIAWQGREPVGVIRIRWFAGFAKLERAAVVRRQRQHGIAHALWEISARIAAQKGYRRMIGHIEPHLAPFWAKCAGLYPRPGRRPFRFSDREYIEVEAELPTVQNPVSIDSAPLIVLRPEGEWDRPGVLDESADRTRKGAAA
jgi:predicted GNAT family N-acyltransferase